MHRYKKTMAHYQMDKITHDVTSLNNKSEEYTLYVNDLPTELNEQGLLQIFNHYGHIKGHFYRPNVTWAYITYGTYLAAENAIKDLNNVPPLRLKISLAREKSSGGVQFTKVAASKDAARQIENRNVPNDVDVNKPFMQSRGRGNPLDVFKRVEPNRSLPQYTYTAEEDLLYPYPSDPHTYNPYDNAEPYASTNALWTRGQLTITQDGKRHVSFGRGHTWYEIPDPHPDIQKYVEDAYEKRTSGAYEYGRDNLENALGICKTCSKKTKFTCEKCYTFYCSRTCQVSNWPQHKFECETIPDLVTSMYGSSLSQSSNVEQTPIRNISNVQMPLRRPKTLVTTITSSNKVIDTIPTERVINNHSSSGCNETANDNDSKYSPIKATNHYDEHKRNKIEKEAIQGNHSPLQKTPFRNDISKDDGSPGKLNSINKTVEKCQKFNADYAQKMENDIAFTKCTILSKTQFTDVRVIITEGRELWIQRVKDESAVAELMIHLQSEVNKSQKVKPIIGNIYAVQYEDVWHRALVTSLKPLTVQYIDYGNEEQIETDDFREINTYKDVPRLSVKIRLSEKACKKYANLKSEDTISVKMLSVDSDKVINVEVEDENCIADVKNLNTQPILNVSTTSAAAPKTPVSSESFVNEKLPSSLNKLKSIVNTMVVEEKGILEVHVEMKNNAYSITLLPHNAISDYEKLLTDLPTMCAQAAEHSNHTPNVGVLLCGQRADGDWLRGYILSLESPLKMVVIDEARIMPINKTVACSENFLNIFAFGAVCEITDPKHKFNSGDQYEFKVIAKRVNNGQEAIEVEISTSKDIIRAIVKPWIPVPEQKGVQYAELKNGSEVALTAFRSHTLLFARPLDTTALEHFSRVMQNVAKCAQTSPCLKEPPVVGQMVIAQYVDENFYRAIATKVENDKVAISYVDFGNTEVTNMKKLRHLTDDLKQLRSCTTKIMLKDVPKDLPMTKEVSDYFSQLVGAEVPLICTFEGVPSKDGVYLKLHSGENINKTISDLLVPTTKESAEKDKTCYMADDLSAIDLGKTGDTVEALVLHSLEDGYKYAMCPLDYDLMTHVFDIMPKKMAAYCERSDNYIPRENELCLALYEGGWYRAACVRRNYTSTTSAVFFVDFGNTEFVSHKDIRLMPKEFMSPNALATVCNLINIAPTDSQGRFSPKVEKRITELVVPDNGIKIKIIKHDLESETYNVELPLVHEKLSQEGLLTV